MNVPAHLLSNEAPDPAQAFSLHLDDLEEQAKQFLDGEAIANEAQAEAVSRLLSMARKAANDADEARKAEKRPHDEAAKAVQEKWRPILTKADDIATTAKRVLAPWLSKLEDEQRAAAETARLEAERLAAAAVHTAEVANPDSLADQTAVRIRRENAADAARAAKRLAKARPQAKGGERAVGLRSVWTAEVTNPVIFARWAWEHRRGEYLTFLDVLAAREATGPKNIPGLIIHEGRTAV